MYNICILLLCYGISRDAIYKRTIILCTFRRVEWRCIENRKQITD